VQALGPLAFFDLRGKERQEAGSTSLVNDGEAKLVMFLYAELVMRYSQLSSGANIAVISPYKGQVS
jgi:superfamily I DNA and/or RNA helicase